MPEAVALMLDLITSNRLEPLVDALAGALRVYSDDPFARPQVLINNPSIGRWLSVELSQRLGLCANVEFILPARFLWQQLERLPATAHITELQKVDLLWRSLLILEQVEHDPDLQALSDYLQRRDAEDDLSRTELAMAIADVFDQYLIYRDDWLVEWQGLSTPPHWQAAFWQRLCATLEGPHRAELQRQLIQTLHQRPPQNNSLPVYFFNTQQLAPSQWAMVEAIGQQQDLILLCIDPSAEFWHDLRAERSLLRQRAEQQRQQRPATETPDYQELGHPLLSAFGRQGQIFHRQLSHLNVVEHQAYVDIEPVHLLSLLQHDILHLNPPDPAQAQALLSEDISLQIHACHSPLREVQVLQDQLLALFDQHPEFSPADVVVLCPDMNHYAPAIEAIFGSAPRERYLPWSLSDRSALKHLSITQALDTLLTLPQRRLSIEEVFSLLALPAVQQRFELEHNALPELQQQVYQAGARWGTDTRMRSEWGEHDDPRFSWRFAFERLFFGHACSADTEVLNGILPDGNLELEQIDSVAKLSLLVDSLDHWREQLKQRFSASEWQSQLKALMAAFFSPQERETLELEQLNDAAAKLAEQSQKSGADALRLDNRAYRRLFTQFSQQHGSAQVFHDGRISFCATQPLRSVPFKVVCLIGLNHGVFPPVTRPAEFDLIAKHPREGDRDRRHDDRYLFLESLLCAREVFYLSYCGRSLKDNTPQMPSIVVAEYLDVLERHYGLTQIVNEHALHPFSAKNYQPRQQPRDYQSYATEWLPNHSSATEQPSNLQPPSTSLWPTEAAQRVSLSDFCQFFKNPAKHYSEHVLGLSVKRADKPIDSDDPLNFDSLIEYHCKEQLIRDALEQRQLSQSKQYLFAHAATPYGAYGDYQLDRVIDKVSPLIELVQSHCQGQLTHQAFQVPLGTGLQIHGKVPLYDGHRLVFWRSGKLHPEYKLKLLITACLLAEQIPQLEAIAIGKASSTNKSNQGIEHWQCPQVDADYKAQLARWYHLGRHQPLPFAPRTGYYNALGKTAEAKKQWFGDKQQHYTVSGEAHDIHWQLVLPERNALTDPECLALAQAIYAPLIDSEPTS